MGIGEILVSISHSRDYAVASSTGGGVRRYADSDSSGDAEA